MNRENGGGSDGEDEELSSQQQIACLEEQLKKKDAELQALKLHLHGPQGESGLPSERTKSERG